jgi:RNA polymerase sigma-70 factor (ECF subfamily)
VTEDHFDDDAARRLRRAWFDFVDLIEPFRPDLHRYCLRLTGQVWAAEDLVQDTLLRAFGAVGRGDMHGATSRLSNARAYVFRAATNLWIDQVRRAGREASLEPTSPETPPDGETLAQVRDAGEALFRDAAPQERAAVVLKDAFDFTLEETAELLSTTVGAVKAALHRGRGRLRTSASDPPRASPPSRALVDRFVAASMARDVAALRATLLETVTIDVHGVGGGRGNKVDWADNAIANTSPRVEARDYRGELIVLHLTARGRLAAVTRIEEADGGISRVRTYLFCPDTTAVLAAEFGLEALRGPYHQGPDTLPRMIASTTLPWLS